MDNAGRTLRVSLIFSVLAGGCGVTDPNDLKILLDFVGRLENPELLKWPALTQNSDPCGEKWEHVYCDENYRITQIQVQDMNLAGTLPPNFNKLTQLSNLGFQRNNFSGNLPSFSGLNELQYAFLDYNKFDFIPMDFFVGLTSLRVIALDGNPLNSSTGWRLPDELQNSVQLMNISAMQCNLVGEIPTYLGNLQLTSLMLSYNELSGEIPSSFTQSPLKILWLNEQDGVGLSGSLDVITSMKWLRQAWFQGNKFSGEIPVNIDALTYLEDLNLNGNQLVGRIPQSLASMKLKKLDLNNNLLMGGIPKFSLTNVSYQNNAFCKTTSPSNCSMEVNALIDVLAGLNYPKVLVSKWTGDDPCSGQWMGVRCNPDSRKITMLYLRKLNLTGNISSSLSKLDSLTEIRLDGNKLTGPIPANLSEMKSLTDLDVSFNNLSPPVPVFSPVVSVITNGNPLLTVSALSPPPSSTVAPPPETVTPFSPAEISSNSKTTKRRRIIVTVAATAIPFVFVLMMILCAHRCRRKTKKLIRKSAPSPVSVVVHPTDPMKLAVSGSYNTGSLSLQSWTSSSGIISQSHLTDAGNAAISVQVLRNVTENFSPEKELGRGGFGVVYRGDLEDGTKFAVKRMEAGVIGKKALDEFQSEIGVLSKVRHRHLVSLLGYAVEGNERLVVYEFMPQGALSRHLFYWKDLQLEPLSWKKRLVIALDVARGMEYLHALARQSFIHRDLKSSNILLDDDYRAKVSDFGLVKLAPDRDASVATKLAGTFGYLAPEYAVMGKITTKADVFSYGVVLMELLTGMTALDEERSEERRYLAEWFGKQKSSRAKLAAAIDPAIKANAEIFDSIAVVAELAGHCTAREPHRRPEMGHAVNVLAPLVEQWTPVNDDEDEASGIDYNLPLTDMIKCWQESEGGDSSYSSGLNDSRSSIPVRPFGFADSFTSSDGR